MKTNPIKGYFKNNGDNVEDVSSSHYVRIGLLGAHALSKDASMLISTSSLTMILHYNWYLGKDGYPVGYKNSGKKRNKGGKIHRMLKGVKGLIVDHINRDRLDNRLENLRLCTAKENSYNTTKPRNSKNKYKGVRKQGKTGKWIASANKDGQRFEIKDIATQKEAAKMYDMMAEDLFGHFA